ncbi:MAG TPA: hypothetical protein VJ521_10625 [Acidobacteriota bacterium]|nr:hypothetical protein [Acidobacteriota bacterium]
MNRFAAGDIQKQSTAEKVRRTSRKGEISPQTYEEWNPETGRAKLAEYALAASASRAHEHP